MSKVSVDRTRSAGSMNVSVRTVTAIFAIDPSNLRNLSAKGSSSGIS